MWDVFSAVLVCKLLGELDYHQRALERAQLYQQREEMKARRKAIGAVKDQLWRQNLALKRTASMLAQEYQQLSVEISSAARNPRLRSHAIQARSRQHDIREQQAEIKHVRAGLHDRLSRLKREQAQYYW